MFISSLTELDSIILELNRIAGRRRFMRDRILGISRQIDYIADWLAWCYEKDTHLPKLHLDYVFQKAQEDLLVVIRYKRCMRKDMDHVFERITLLQRILCAIDE